MKPEIRAIRDKRLKDHEKAHEKAKGKGHKKHHEPKPEPEVQDIVQEEWTLEEDLPEDEAEVETEEDDGEPAWKDFGDKPQWEKFKEGLPPGLAKKQDDSPDEEEPE